MQERIGPYVYLIYMLVLKHRMAPEEIYLACKNNSEALIPWSIVVWPNGTQIRPTPRPSEIMGNWMRRVLRHAGITGHYDGPYNIIGGGEIYSMPSSLAGFIAKYATNRIKLNWWDRAKRWF